MSGRRAAGLALALAFALGAAPPDVVRVRVPSGRVSAWFPTGAEVIGLKADRFEALVKDAADGAARRDAAVAPHWLTARHSARWDDGVLVGRTVLTPAPDADSPAEIALEPWTPAVHGGPAALRSTDGGRVLVRVGGPEAVEVDWRLRARPGSRGRKFQVGLPAVATSELTLDLPEGWEPDGPPGLRRGPEPGGSPGRAVWSFAGPLPAAELRLLSPDGRDDPLEGPALWCAGPTRVAVSESAADWSLDWTVTAAAAGPRVLILDLDPGLEFLAATGPAVEDARGEPAADLDPSGGRPTRLSVRLRSAAGGTRVAVKAVAVVPPEGPWRVPSARPVNAVWTGGLTTVRVGPSRVVREVRPLAGGRVPAAAADGSDDLTLAFQAVRPGAVAGIEFRKPWADASAEVRGRLLVGNRSPRLECRVTWRATRGRLDPDLGLDLPPAWSADRVEVEGADAPAAWHAEPAPGGGVRLRVAAAAGGGSERSVALLVSATAAVAGGRGPLALPRVKPVGARAADEVWEAFTEDGMALRPTLAKGLAWVAPDPTPATPAKPALAWRWVADGAEARVERERDDPAKSAAIDLTASVGLDRLRVEGRVVATAPPGSNGAEFGLNAAVADPAAWRFFDESTGLEIDATALGPDARSSSGIPGDGPAWRLTLPNAADGRARLTVRYEGRRESASPMPLLFPPAGVEARGAVLVLTGPDVRATPTAAGVATLDPDVTAEAFAAPADMRRSFAYAYDDPAARVGLRTEPLTPAGPGRVIRDAHLTTVLHPGGPSRHRLTLRVGAGPSNAVDVVLPPGSTLERVRRDGLPVAPTAGGRAVSVNLGPASTATARGLVTVTLEYQTPGPAGGLETSVSPARPRFSLPCLAMAWDVVAPRAMALTDWGDALVPADPGRSRPTAVERLAPGLDWGRWRRARRVAVDPSRFRDLNARTAVMQDGLSLCEWLLRWDGGESPVVVDRTALASAGWGPRSRVAANRADPAQVGAARALLGPLGLTLVPVGRAVLVTTRDEAAAVAEAVRGPSRAAWEAALAGASAWGSDDSDRFQSVGRWRDEPTPRPAPAGDTSAAFALDPSAAVHRFVATGWPDREASVTLVDRDRRAGLIAVCAVAWLTLGLAAGAWPRAARASLWGFGLALGCATSALGSAWWSASGTGLVAGSAGLACLAVGRSLHGIRLPRRRRAGSRGARSYRAGGSSLTASAGAVLVGLVGLGSPWAFGQSGLDHPILALFPYDGPPDPLGTPDRVVLALADYRRLRTLAEPPAAAAEGLRATSAVHAVRWDGGDVAVTSEFRLTGGPGPLAWTFPIDEARGITADVDGVPAPVRVADGGRSGSVVVAGDGPSREASHRLTLRRRVTPVTGDRGPSATVAVNRVASARVDVGPHPDGLRCEAPNARGVVAAGPRGGLSGAVGPVDRLELRWAAGKPEVRKAAGSVDGLFLWDASPAGDRVRARLTYRNPDGTAVLRVALEPGTRVREADVPGAVDVAWEGPADRPVWTARVDPPLPDGATVALDVWRARPAEQAAAASAPRLPPRVEPLGVERFTAAIAFRRPPDWSGRLNAPDAPGEEAFARTWGPLPDDPLTLSGTARVGAAAGRPWPEVAAGPAAAVFRVRASARATVNRGRLDLNVFADLVEAEASVDHVDVVVPEGFRPVRVTATGLTDWHEPAPRTLRLRFDGPPERARRVDLEGWIAAPCDPFAAAPAGPDVPFPWTAWPGQEEQTGTLVVVSPTRVQATLANGRPLAAADSAPAVLFAGATRSTYKIDRPADLGRLRWDAEPPRADVRVVSQVTVDPDSAGWLAVVRYDVAGGPLDAINLKLPTEWARGAKVEVPGRGHHLVADVRGESTYWSVRPDRPVWGSQRVIVRGSRPLSGGESLAFPELAPLGRGGAVDAYARVVNATKRPLPMESSPELQAVAAQAVPAEPEFDRAPRGEAVGQYRVARPGWSLRLRTSRDAGRSGEARVTRAELACTVGADGLAVGLGRYDLAADSGATFAVTLPTGAEPLWASVEGAPVVPTVAGPGRWEVPIVDPAADRLVLVWRGEAAATADATANGPLPVPMPVVGRDRVPAIVTVYAPEGATVASRSDRLRAAASGRAETELAVWAKARAADRLARFDRDSRKDGDDVLALLIQAELLLRQAERAPKWDRRLAEPLRPALSSRSALAARAVRAEFDQALRSRSLESYRATSRAVLGLDPAAASPSTGLSPDPTGAAPVRPIGRPSSFVGDSPLGAGPALVWTPAPEPVRPWAAFSWPSALFFAGVVAGLSAAASRVFALKRLAGVAGLPVLGFAATLGGPWGLAAGVGLVALGFVAPRSAWVGAKAPDAA